MGNDDANFVRLEQALNRLESAIAGVGERLALDQGMTGRHAQLRSEVSAAIADIDQLLATKNG